ncbi:tripartite tricarboxylate transporter substrate binding protein [Alcaligenaceae bacterium]|nr:tripartite tricarboxylate transporter substrate binding protein [Alcaligenaceae bacterium]
MYRGKSGAFRVFAMAAVAASLSVMAGASLADTGSWPNKSIRVIVPYTPGGSVDTSTRMVMEQVAKAIGQTIVVENKPGANTTIGTTQLMRSAPDGYTFGIVPATYTANYALFKNLPYKHADFAPVGHIVDIPMFLFTQAQAPANTVQELVAYGKTKSMNYASTGPGSTGHFLGALFTQTTGINAEHVPYNGSAPILTDLMAGQIDFIFDPAIVPMPHVKTGKLKVLAVSLPKRCACEPDVPTMEEAGYPGFVQSSWIGLLAPAGTPPAIIERMSKEMATVINNPDIAKKFQNLGFSGVGSTPQQFQALIDRDTQSYKKIAESAKISIE